MLRREFHLEDGTSRKFWAISVEGSKCTIQFGKIGSSGQTQVKELPSSEAAQAAADKLIDEKTRKGYQEVTTAASGSAPPPAPPPAPAKVSAASRKKGPLLEVTRSIIRDLTGLRGPVWDQPLGDVMPKPTAAPFNLAGALKTMHKANNEWPPHFLWSQLYVADAVTPEEAVFWFRVFSSMPNSGQAERKAFIEGLKNEDFSKKPSLPELIQGFSKYQEGFENARPMFAQASWLSPEDMLSLAHAHPYVGKGWHQILHIYRWLRNLYLPHLSAADRERAGAWVRDNLPKLQWPAAQMCAYCAMDLNLHACLGPFVAALPDGFFANNPWSWGSHAILFSLSTPEEVERQVRRTRLTLGSPEHAEAWLAWTEYRGLDLIGEAALRAGKGYQAEGYTDLLCAVRAPEVTPWLLDIKVNIKTPRLAKKAQAALEAQPANAVVGLVPLAGRRDKVGEAALHFLLDARARGLGELIDEQLKSASREAVSRLSAGEEAQAPAPAAEQMDESSMPDWLREGLKATASKGRIPDWVLPETLPAIRVEGKALPAEHVATVVHALMASTLDAPAPLVRALRERGERGSLQDFGWALFERWQNATAPSKEKWAFLALGHLGGDATVLALTPLIRAWPGQSQHQRAVTGLEVLRTIGTDTALMALNGMAQKLKFRGLQERAVHMMNSIASDRGLTRPQLEDRIIPDLGLDAQGGRTFDYGPRKFSLAVTGEMEFMVRDTSGKLLKDPPKPGAKDDTAKATAALEEWKLLKKQLREVTKVQVERLEQAMIVGRRWSPEDFETFLVRHPLMTLIAQRLLWAGYDKKGKLLRLLRVTGEQTYVAADDQPGSLEGLASVGLPHPLHLSAEQKATWQQAFARHQLTSPFPQLRRETFTLTEKEAKGSSFRRSREKMPATAVRGYLEGTGWGRILHDHGGIEAFFKPFPAANVTGVLLIDPAILMGFADNEDVEVTKVFFVAGLNEPGRYEGIPLAGIDPVAMSEVLRDLDEIGKKAGK